MTSLQSNAEISARGVWHIPENATLDNFVDIWNDTPTPRYLLNSFLVTIPATALSVLGGVLLGYVFSHFRFPFAELLFLVVIAGMFFPPQAHAHPALPHVQLAGRDHGLPDPAGALRHGLPDDPHPHEHRD